jgi:hypothetical protein
LPYVVRCFPHDDEGFAAHATAALARYDGHTPDDSDGVPEAVAEFMRGTYPLVSVHRSDPLAVVVPNERTLYIYRDGTQLAK